MAHQPKITIVHGWSYSMEKWQPFVELLKAGGYQVNVLAVPGLTESLEEAWTLDNYVEWLKSKLDGDQPHILLGHSNGGRIALAFVHKYPKAVTQLVLIDSAGIIHRDLKTKLKRSTFRFLAKMGKSVSNAGFLRKILYKLAREQDYNQASPVMKQTMVNLISVDLQPWLFEINTPTVLIWGADDRATPLSDGQQMKRSLAHARLSVVDGARHSPQFTHPETTARAVIEGLKAV